MSIRSQTSVRWWQAGAVILILIVVFSVFIDWSGTEPVIPVPNSPSPTPQITFQPRRHIDTSGYQLVLRRIPPWPAKASLEELAVPWRRCGQRLIDELDKLNARHRESGYLPPEVYSQSLLEKASLLNYEGEAGKAYEVLGELRALVESDNTLNAQILYTVIYFQGITALRRGETDNCLMCRGESSCILPISGSAVHTNPIGSRLAIQHFTEYLSQFPNDLEAQWLMNIAYMTLGEYPDKVDPRFRISLDLFNRTEFGIGKFRDVGHLVGIDRLSQAGGAIMDDFDNDGLLDLVFTSFDQTKPLVFYRNKGDGTFEDRTEAAGLMKQLGGINCVQTDYNNDGFLDIFIVRGAWVEPPMRPSLLRNNGNGTFTDVTAEAGLLDPVNSISAAWADYDNDGFLDLFVCCEGQPNKLYRNRGDGTFEEVAKRAGVAGHRTVCKGAAWIDFNNDGYPDLFVNNLSGTAALYRNNGNGTFTEVTDKMGIDGPKCGFACWA
ncbi:MAG TPA: VCBS repeat-containing protein, partial [Gemmata sp.]|nr:VCBS repeat-containing protein [Gemmata sp.]